VSRRIGRPYAAALYSVLAARAPQALRETLGQLEAVEQAFGREPALLRVFEVPTVPPGTKRELLLAIGKGVGLRVEVQRLLAALVQHARLRFLPDVVTAFRELVEGREGTVRGRVELPAAPSRKQLDALAAALADRLGVKVELESSVRPELLAGFIVRLGSRLFDGSLRTQLERFAAGARALEGVRHADQG
jgi:F-type H+-transporting ATPase subunit delta